jgi:uncharacterized protein YjbI with pentapeptide repeats
VPASPRPPLHSTDFHGDLRGAKLIGATLRGADLRQADLSCADLTGADLNGALLQTATAHGARFRGASLAGAQLAGLCARDADLEGASLIGADLRGADLRGALLLEADLSGADLRQADLRGADLRGADLSHARLEGAKLDLADLAGAILSGTQLDGISASGARLHGLDPTDALARALLAAGAQYRAPLTIGRLGAFSLGLVQTTGRGARTIGRMSWAAVAPVRTRLGPGLARLAGPVWTLLAFLVRTTQAQMRGTASAAGRLARQTGRGIRAASATVGARVAQSSAVAARVRQEARERLQQIAAERALRDQAKAARATEVRAQRAKAAQTRIPGGPGADLREADLRGKRLAFASWAEADLRGVRLDGAVLDKADLRGARLDSARMVGVRLREADLGGASAAHVQLEGARLRGAILTQLHAPGANLIDADLRKVDLRGADLTGANLTGADLRGARLSGAILRTANLTGARLPDVDLMDADLSGAILEQADLAGVRWAGAVVQGADLAGALGLTGRQRDALRARGATVEDVHLERVLGQLGARPIQAAVAVLALGMGAYLLARFAASDTVDPARLEVEAKELRASDPLAASKRYTELARLSRRTEDRIGYLIEAADLADGAGKVEDAERQLREALAATSEVPQMAPETQLRLGSFLYAHQRYSDALAEVEPLVQVVDQPTEQRARAVLLYERTRRALGLTDDARKAIFSAMGDLPETQAELRLALAELRANQADTAGALAELDATAALELPENLRWRLLAARARVYDKAGDLAEALSTWRSVEARADPETIAGQAARLAIADLHLRQGRPRAAQSALATLLAGKPDPRIRGRALIVQGRLHEAGGQLDQAVEAYREVLQIARLDTDTIEEARIALASLVLGQSGADQAAALLADLAPGAVTEIMAHARLGEARGYLDDGDAGTAHGVYEALLQTEDLPATVERAARAGLGEALAQMGELQDALQIWRALLGADNSPDERIQLELLLANGLLQGGKRKEAATAFRSLADSESPEARVQGLLGLAEVARAADERQRAQTLYRQIADRFSETTWRVRALQELADMATEDGRGEESLEIRRELLASLPPSHPAAPEARLALIGALINAGANEEAVGVCQQAVSAASGPEAARSARIACAEADERSGRWTAALTAYIEVLYHPDSPADVVVDAALGASRASWQLSGAEEAARVLLDGLSRTETPSDRLPLLSARIQMLRNTADTAALRDAESERDALADQAPEVAWYAFLESSGQARSQGDPAAAIGLLNKALGLPLSTAQRARVLVELGGAHLDQGELTAATTRFTQAAELGSDDPVITFHAGMGQAEILRQGGSPADAAAMLAELTAPDKEEQRWLLQARGQALTEAGDPEAETIWAALAQSADGDPGTRYTALRGRADALMGQDLAAEALPLYQEAERISREPWEQGWAALGVAETQAELGDLDASYAALDTLREHSDPEVRMQACIRRSQLAAVAEDWDTALLVLPSSDTDAMGPAWDASATAARAGALLGAGDPDGAESAYRALAQRWPEEEEGYLPAWLGLAQLAQQQGDDAGAHRWARKAFRGASDPGYRRQARDIVREVAD